MDDDDDDEDDEDEMVFVQGAQVSGRDTVDGGVRYVRLWCT